MSNNHRNVVYYSNGFRCALIGLSALMIAGCSLHTEPGNTQVVAKVDGQEVTVYEVNQYVHQQSTYSGTPEQISRHAIDAVIDQHLLVAEAKLAEVDRKPEVMQTLLLNYKDTLIKAYLAQLAIQLPNPTAAEISAYYQAHSQLFSNRKLYVINQLHIQAEEEKQQQLINQLQASNSVGDFITGLGTQSILYDEWQTIVAPEAMSQYEQNAMITLPIDGVLILNQTEHAFDIAILVNRLPKPIALDMAKLTISELLIRESQAKKVAELIQGLRRHAKIEYLDQKHSP